MRGKCETCEFYVVSSETAEHEGETYIGDGRCHIRSVVDRWPWRRQDEGCGEHQEKEVETVATGPIQCKGFFDWTLA